MRLSSVLGIGLPAVIGVVAQHVANAPHRLAGTMFVWARIPDFIQEQLRAQIPEGASLSLEFSKRLIAEARVAISPGIGFGEYGDDHVRFGLIENEHRTRQAIRGIKEMFRRESRAGA